MAKQMQYIGARYVTKVYENTISPNSAEWQSNVTYEPLTMVTYNNSSYLSKKEVPATVGNPAENSEYWVVTGNYNGQIANLDRRVDNVEESISAESIARANADSSIRTSLSNEVTARTNADESLSSNIQTLTTNLTAVSNNLSTETQSRIEADANLQSQIDEIIAPSGEAPSAAEVENARIGANGVTYNTLGNAIRGQFDDTNDNLNNKIDSCFEQALTIEQIYTGKIVAFRGDNSFQLNDNADYDTLCIGYKRKGIIQIYPTYARAYLVADSIGERVGQMLENESFAIGSNVRSITTTHDGYIYITVFAAESTTDYGYYFKGADIEVAEYIKSDKVDEMETTLNKLLFKSPNMVDPTEIQDSTVMNPNGTKSESILYDLIEDIDVVAGVEYAISGKARSLILKDETDQVIYTDTTDHTDPYTFTLSLSGKLSINFYKNSPPRYLQPATFGNIYYPYGEYIKGNYENVLFGKGIMNFGDSISNGDGNSNVGPAELVAEHNNMSCVDFAINGAYLAFNGAGTNTNCVLQKVTDAVEDATLDYPDFILIDGGINDLKRADLESITPAQIIGTYATPQSMNGFSENYINTVNTKTVCGALETIFYKLITKFPKAQLIFMFPHVTGTHFTDGTPELYTAEKGVCEKWNVPMLDMYKKGGLNLAINAMYEQFGGGDHTHVNAEGYRIFYVPKLTAMLKDMCPYYSE